MPNKKTQTLQAPTDLIHRIESIDWNSIGQKIRKEAHYIKESLLSLFGASGEKELTADQKAKKLHLAEVGLTKAKENLELRKDAFEKASSKLKEAEERLKSAKDELKKAKADYIQ